MSRVGREREELCQKKKNKRERERERENLNLFKTLNVPCVYKGFECLWFFLFFFVLPFGKELFHFKGGEEEEEEDSIIKSTTQNTDKRERRL